MKTHKKTSKNIPACKWVKILDDYPEWVEMCPWDELNVQDWVRMPERHPKHWNRCSGLIRQKFTGRDWAELLAAVPAFSTRCDWTKTDDGNEEPDDCVRHKRTSFHPCAVDVGVVRRLPPRRQILRLQLEPDGNNGMTP